MAELDTIAAIATPAGVGGIGIVRISGTRVPEIAQQVLARPAAARQAVLTNFLDSHGNAIDQGLALYFPAPASYTGEHVLELHGHGGPVVLDLLLAMVLKHGARLARPGEFSERAFLNDKLDLAQAEAVADLIESGSREAARAAMRSLRGEFSERIRSLSQALIEMRVQVEAALDFADEDIDFLDDETLVHRCAQVHARVSECFASAQQGVLLSEGMTVVITGAPNVGKSSLINCLAGFDTAIVTDVPGTTRDVLRERIHVDGMPLHIVDTAGLQETADLVEQEGIKRAWAQIEQADLILLVTDATRPVDNLHAEIQARLPAGVPCDIVRNKIDLCDELPGVYDAGAETVISISAKYGTGIELLRERMLECMGYRHNDADTLIARRRHLQALQHTEEHLASAQTQMQARADAGLIAEELRLAQRYLGEILGEFTTDDLLGRIFSTFCIGK
ncbi:MAG: tRNA uridine-5-carboxymethylaminomethyl(34) synthesis GTPase MnmE [Gammaproteobacteria bacterium]|nr:tRNA uridine-5-carboxymethylaminomethyl(34) synthesis GTPase MnmE [Gammaproteobacteria bacterium]